MSESRKPGEPAVRAGTLIEPVGQPAVAQPGRPQPVERSGTVIETDEDIRQAFLSGQKGRQPGQPVVVDPPAPIPVAPSRRRRAPLSPFDLRSGRRWPY